MNCIIRVFNQRNVNRCYRFNQKNPANDLVSQFDNGTLKNNHFIVKKLQLKYCSA